MKNKILTNTNKQEQDLLHKNYIINKTGKEYILDEYLINDDNDWLAYTEYFDRMNLNYMIVFLNKIIFCVKSKHFGI